MRAVYPFLLIYENFDESALSSTCLSNKRDDLRISELVLIGIAVIKNGSVVIVTHQPKPSRIFILDMQHLLFIVILGWGEDLF